MFLAIDIGGTKTLLAVFTADGQLREERRFLTNQDYKRFLKDLQHEVGALVTKDFLRIGLAVPGTLDREKGVVLACGNLPWQKKAILNDVEKLFNTPAIFENDTKLAGFSEALALLPKYKRSLYLTISTGIGVALIEDGVINTGIGDRGGNAMYFQHEGKMKSWEGFASGKAIVKRFGKKASEITDKKIWHQLARDFSIGILELIAILEPEIVIIGGGVGQHFDKYGAELKKILISYETPMLKIPPIIEAKRAEEAVIYGCYELAKRHTEMSKK